MGACGGVVIGSLCCYVINVATAAICAIVEVITIVTKEVSRLAVVVN